MPSVTLNAAQTAFISSAQPANNFSSHPLICVGNDAELQNCVGFLKFALPALPVTAVDSASIELTVLAKTGAGPSRISVGRVPSFLDIGTVTFNLRPALIAAEAGITVTAADLYKTVKLDVTTLVNEWLSGAYPNNGFALMNDDGVSVVQFASVNILVYVNFPRLVLSFSLSAPNVPDVISQSNTRNDVSINKTDVLTRAPALNNTEALTLAPSLSNADALTLAPGLSKTDALTLAPRLSYTDALTLAPGLSINNAWLASPQASAALALGFSAGLNSALTSPGTRLNTGPGVVSAQSSAPSVILINTTGERVTFSSPDGHSGVLVIKLSRDCGRVQGDDL